VYNGKTVFEEGMVCVWRTGGIEKNIGHVEPTVDEDAKVYEEATVYEEVIAS
jgi:hypothetical protein